MSTYDEMLTLQKTSTVTAPEPPKTVEVAADAAWAEHYTVATHRWPLNEQGETRDMIAAVRYVDRMERRGGGWRIARRVMVLDWHRIEPVSGVDVGMAGGRRDRSDPSYSR